MAKGRDKRKRAAKRRKKGGGVGAGEAHLNEPPSIGDSDAFVHSNLKPRPHSGSGAVSLPEPEEVEEEVTIRFASRLNQR